MPTDVRRGGGAWEAFSCRMFVVASMGKPAKWDTGASFRECSEEYGRTRVTAMFCGWTRQHEPFAFIAVEPQAVIIPWQHACCPVGCVARRQADAGIAIHRTIIASIKNALFLSLPTCIV